ncbi:serine hydrolase domain-containing protein [Candidatus Enterococcus mansonii]|uniref:Beta-lactamase-related domain-containing protein n=1 Tax=Candidatus Enterococcus mansonii TaxID=1834181 RepID=A0A242CHX1_9ENTE|nr:serine hydrolase [Enterococcus sp. 4G2_DIV0659]OTO09510.1 hypothetical protein A5880_000189 [Enterococcus sp. 4G2_DIV0659]
MNTTKINEQIETMVEQKIISGASWSTINQTDIVNHYKGKMGSTPPFNQQDIHASCYYDLASLTKVIGTTTRILQLIDEGKLHLKTSVAKVLPNYANLTMTIEDLLLHRSGLPADVTDKQSFDQTKLQKIFKQYSINQQSAIFYSDLGYLLLGWVINEIDGCSLEESFRTFIFEPLEMKQTSFYLEKKEVAVPTEQTVDRGMIQGIVHDSKAWQLAEPVGSAGLFSTLNDVNMFVAAFLLNRLPNGQPMFSESLYASILTTNYFNRTFGWEKKMNSSGQWFLYHTGFTGTSIGLKPCEGEALIVLTNRIHPTRNNQVFLERRSELYSKYF